MIITRTQSAGIREFVRYLGGNPKLVEEAVEELGSPEIISCSPGPSTHCLSPQERIALTTIQNYITGSNCSMPPREACKVLEEVICRDMEPKELEQYIKNLDQSFARNSIPFKSVLLSHINNNLTPIFVVFFGLFFTSLLALTQHKSKEADQRPSINRTYPEIKGTEYNPTFQTPYPAQYPALRDYKPAIYTYEERFQNKKKEKKESLP
jgi:hypothetical protein